MTEALDCLQEFNPAIVAGGTDFFPSLGDASPPKTIMDLSRVSEMRGIVRMETEWRIGASTTWSELVNANVPPCFDAMKLAAVEIGSVQIQNAGTIAGNLCNASPAADGVPPLLVLDAEVELASRNRVRRLKLQDFISDVRKTARNADEIVTAIVVPDTSSVSVSSFLKLGSRTYLVISIAMVAAVIQLDEQEVVKDIRIAVGACSPVACRLPELEQKLTGRHKDELKNPSLFARESFSRLSPIDDVRGSAEFRLETVSEICRRCISDALDGERQSIG